MTPYERQTAAIESALNALDAAANSACDTEDYEDMNLFVGAAQELRDAFSLPHPLYPVVLTMDEEDEPHEDTPSLEDGGRTLGSYSS